MQSVKISTDFNNAKPQGNFDLIPKETITKAVVWLREGNHGDDNCLYITSNGSIGLKVDFVIDEGPYKNRKIRQLIGLQGLKKDDQSNDIWGDMGRSLIRGIVESAYNIHYEDESEEAKNKRSIKNYKDLNGLKCLVKIGIQVDKTKKYDDQNKVTRIITPNHQEYNTLMNSVSMANHSSTSTIKNINSNDVKNDFDDEIPF